MSLVSNPHKFLLLLNLFATLNLIGKTNQSAEMPVKSGQQNHPQSAGHKKKSVEQTNKVLEVKSKAELQTQLNNNSMVALEFYIPDCGCCTMFQKKYEELAKKNPAVTFLKINGDLDQSLIEQYNITAYPSFVFILNNEKPIKTVVGGHKTSIEKALRELVRLANAPRTNKSNPKPASAVPSNPLIQEIASLAELDALIQAAGDKLVVVDYHAESWCGPCKFFGPQFNELANAHSDVAVFVKVEDKKDQQNGNQISNKHKVTGLPTILIFKGKNSDQPTARVSGANKEGVKQAILQAAPTK